jgi:hypothetical protein
LGDGVIGNDHRALSFLPVEHPPPPIGEIMATKLEKAVSRETSVIEKMVPLIVTLRPNQTMGFKLKYKQEEIIVDIEALYRFAKGQAITGKARIS